MRTISFLCLALPAMARAAVAEPAVPLVPLVSFVQPMQQITITGGKLEQRRQDSSATIVVGHEEIARQGDRSLADVLKRLPGISIDGAPGQGGQIRMRGLGEGYTRILLNGIPAPTGFSLDSIAPELIERIEIMRTASAELSNQSIAGVINVILKKSVARSQRELKLGMAGKGGVLSPQLTAQLADRTGALSYSMAATAGTNRGDTPSLERQERRGLGGALELLRSKLEREIGRERVLNLAPRLSWTFAGGDSVSWQSYANLKLIDNRHLAHDSTLLGEPGEFPESEASYRARNVVLRNDLNWVGKLAGGARFELKVGSSSLRRRADFLFHGLGLDPAHGTVHQVASGVSERAYSVAGTYRQPIGERHALALGWDGGVKTRGEFRAEAQFASGRPAPGARPEADPLSQLDSTYENYDARLRQLAVFLQDEWQVTPRWSLSLGLRREGLHTVGQGDAPLPVNVRSGVWSPVLHSLYKLAGNDQWRLALGRSYKAPTIQALLPRRYTTDTNNNAAHPDTQGNPALRPELAWGLDAAYEHYFAGDGMLSAGVFARRIKDVTLNNLFQSNGRWIEIPVNDGAATVRGIELEAKLPLQSVWKSGPALDVRANLTRNWSALERVPGPHNRLDEQVPLSANLGFDYRWPAAPLSVGASFTYQGGGPVRLSERLSAASSPKRELDLYALWKFDDRTRLRLSASNLLGQDRIEESRYRDQGGELHTTMATTARPTLRLSLERQL